MTDRKQLFGKIKAIDLVAVSLLCVGLTACGGGGAPAAPVVQAPAAPPPVPVVQVDPAEFRTAEFNRQFGLGAINAEEAYARGFTGEGVSVGVIDFNFEFTDPEISFNANSQSADDEFRAIYEDFFGEVRDDGVHAQFVSSIIAGRRNDDLTHGVAFDGEVFGIDFFSGVNNRTVEFRGDTFIVSDPYTFLLENGVRIVNQSFGFDEGANTGGGNGGGTTGGDLIYTLDTEAIFVAGGGLVVSSAGNNFDPEPSLSNLRLVDFLKDENLFFDGPGALLIVGAVDENNVIADFSDRAGTDPDVANIYLVAPGVDIVAGLDGGLLQGNGTSFAAPHVSAAAAILQQRWPELSARAISEILLDTATDLGEAGTDAVYGRGLLNLGEAVQAQGTQRTSANSVAPSAIGSFLVTPKAFGRPTALTDRLSNVTVFDRFNRDFQIDLSSSVTFQSGIISLGDRLDAQAAWQSAQLGIGGVNAQISAAELRIGNNPTYEGRSIETLQQETRVTLQFTGDTKAYGIEGEYFVGRGTGLTDVLSREVPNLAGALRLTDAFRDVYDFGVSNYAVFATDIAENTTVQTGFSIGTLGNLDRLNPDIQEVDTPYTRAAVRLDQRFGAALLGVELGVLSEQGSLLGARSHGGLALASEANTSSVTLETDVPLGANWTIRARAGAGFTRTRGFNAGAFLQGVDNIWTTSAAFEVNRLNTFQEGDVFSFGVSQPLRVENALARFSGAIGRDEATNQLQFVTETIRLAPDGREIALEGRYSSRPFGFLGGFNLEAGTVYRFNADHVSGLNDLQVLMVMSRRF